MEHLAVILIVAGAFFSGVLYRGIKADIQENKLIKKINENHQEYLQEVNHYRQKSETYLCSLKHARQILSYLTIKFS